MANVAELNNIVTRSKEFETELFKVFDSASFETTVRNEAVVAMFNISQEHAIALVELTQMRLLTTALSLLRLQYESLVREVWVLYIASESEINKLMAPLTNENEQIASNSIPSYAKMMESIEKKGPAGLHRHLIAFKDNSWRALNSFVHGGIHAVSRSRNGYPVDLMLGTIKQSNNLRLMSAVGLAEIYRSAEITLTVSSLHKKYADCLLLEK